MPPSRRVPEENTAGRKVQWPPFSTYSSGRPELTFHRRSVISRGLAGTECPLSSMYFFLFFSTSDSPLSPLCFCSLLLFLFTPPSFADSISTGKCQKISPSPHTQERSVSPPHVPLTHFDYVCLHVASHCSTRLELVGSHSTFLRHRWKCPKSKKVTVEGKSTFFFKSFESPVIVYLERKLVIESMEITSSQSVRFQS